MDFKVDSKGSFFYKMGSNKDFFFIKEAGRASVFVEWDNHIE